MTRSAGHDAALAQRQESRGAASEGAAVTALLLPLVAPGPLPGDAPSDGATQQLELGTRLTSEPSAPDDAGAARHQDQCDSPARAARARIAKPPAGAAASGTRSSQGGSGGLGSPAKRTGGSPARTADQAGRRRPARGEGHDTPCGAARSSLTPPSAPPRQGPCEGQQHQGGEEGDADGSHEDQAPAAFATPLAATPPGHAAGMAPTPQASAGWRCGSPAGDEGAFLTPCAVDEARAAAAGSSAELAAEFEHPGADGADTSAQQFIAPWRASPAAAAGAHRYGSPGPSEGAAASSSAAASGTDRGAPTVALTEAMSAPRSAAATISVSFSGAAAGEATGGGAGTPDGAQSRLARGSGHEQREEAAAPAAAAEAVLYAEARAQVPQEQQQYREGADSKQHGTGSALATPTAAGGLASWLRPASSWLQAAAAAAAAGARAVPTIVASPPGSTGSPTAKPPRDEGTAPAAARGCIAAEGAAAAPAELPSEVDATVGATEAAAAAEATAAEAGAESAPAVAEAEAPAPEGVEPLGADALSGLLPLEGGGESGDEEGLLGFHAADPAACDAAFAAAAVGLVAAMDESPFYGSCAASPEPSLPPLSADSSSNVAVALAAQQALAGRVASAGGRLKATAACPTPGCVTPEGPKRGGGPAAQAPPSASRGSGGGTPQALTPTKATCMGVRLTRAQLLQQEQRRATAARSGRGTDAAGGSGSSGGGGRSKPPRRLTMPGATGPGQQRRPVPPHAALPHARGGIAGAADAATSASAHGAVPEELLARSSGHRLGASGCGVAPALEGPEPGPSAGVQAPAGEAGRRASYVQLLEAQYGESDLVVKGLV
jgi:hypothetical protein